MSASSRIAAAPSTCSLARGLTGRQHGNVRRPCGSGMGPASHPRRRQRAPSASPEIPRLHPDRVEMQVADEHVAGFGMPGVGGGAGVVELVATAVRQREGAAAAHAGEGERLVRLSRARRRPVAFGPRSDIPNRAVIWSRCRLFPGGICGFAIWLTRARSSTVGS